MFRKNKQLIKSLIFGLMGAIMLSGMHASPVHAAESCFEGVGDTVVPYPGILYTRIKAKCEMKLYYMDATFENSKAFDGISGDLTFQIHEQMSGVDDSRGRYQMWWNKDEENPDTVDDRPYVDVLPGEDLFGMSYGVFAGTTVFKRNMPITINSARYEIDGEMRTEENVVLDAVVTVNPDDTKEVLMVSGVETQEVSYNGQPNLPHEGELVVEANDGGVTAEDLSERFFDAEDRETEIAQPSEPGKYIIEYYYEDENYRASLRVPFTIKEYVSVSVELQGGEGEMSAPAYVDLGGNAHIDIVPADGFEVLWVEQNGVDVTEDLNEDNSLDIENLTEDVEVTAVFLPVYLVTEGDEGEYAKGSGSSLAFKIDKNPASYTDEIVTVRVDGEYIDLNNDVKVEPEKQSVTLANSFLETLALGEHNLEVFFFDTDRNGIARATFYVVEPEESEEKAVLTPKTGAGVAEGKVSGASVGKSSFITIGGVIIGMFAVGVYRSLRKR